MLHNEIVERKPGLIPGIFRIKAGSEDEPSVTHISVAQHFVYLDDSRGSLPVRDASYEVARSIVEDFINSQVATSEGVYPGIFWCPGELSIEEVRELHGDLLQTVGIAHRRWYLRLTQMADDDFSRYQKHNVVSDFQRKVAEILKLDQKQHPWMNTNNTLESHSCPGCGNLYRPGIAVCSNCRTILDKEKYEALEFAR